jgi:ATP-dependent protease HslVU (ClpYQ) peptidase subunit
MTTLAAIQGPSWVVVGYDSQVSEADGRKYELPANAGKCFEVGGYVLGVAGDFRAINILAHNFRPPDAGKNSGEELDKFMTTKFVPALKKCFDDNFYGKDGEHGSLVLVVVNATAYEIGGNYDCLRDSRGLYSLGSGSDYALGALFALDSSRRRTVKNAQEMMAIALEIAASLDPGTSEPTVVATYR